MTSAWADQVDDVVAQLAGHIRMIGVDFDKTFISKHTGGGPFRHDDIVRAVEPVFPIIMKAAQTHGIQSSIVTFSTQEEAIAEVLRVVLASDNMPLVVRGSGARDYALPPRDGAAAVARGGKSPHLASAWCALIGDEVAFAQMLLIDDDAANVKNARARGAAAIHWSGDPEELVRDLARVAERRRDDAAAVRRPCRWCGCCTSSRAKPALPGADAGASR